MTVRRMGPVLACCVVAVVLGVRWLVRLGCRETVTLSEFGVPVCR